MNSTLGQASAGNLWGIASSNLYCVFLGLYPAALTRSSPRLIYMPTLATDIVPRLFTLESIGLVNSF